MKKHFPSIYMGKSASNCAALDNMVLIRFAVCAMFTCIGMHKGRRDSARLPVLQIFTTNRVWSIEMQCKYFEEEEEARLDATNC